MTVACQIARAGKSFFWQVTLVRNTDACFRCSLAYMLHLSSLQWRDRCHRTWRIGWMKKYDIWTLLYQSIPSFHIYFHSKTNYFRKERKKALSYGWITKSLCKTTMAILYLHWFIRNFFLRYESDLDWHVNLLNKFIFKKKFFF